MYESVQRQQIPRLLLAKWTLASIVLLTASCGVWPPGQALERVCTARGCTSGLNISGPVDVQPGTRFTVELCIDGTCVNGRGRAAVKDKFNASVGEFEGSKGLSVDVIDGHLRVQWQPTDASSLADGRPRDVSLTMRSSGRRIVERRDTVQFEPTWPNGKECDPQPCWQAGFEV